MCQNQIEIYRFMTMTPITRKTVTQKVQNGIPQKNNYDRKKYVTNSLYESIYMWCNFTAKCHSCALHMHRGLTGHPAPNFHDEDMTETMQPLLLTGQSQVKKQRKHIALQARHYALFSSIVNGLHFSCCRFFSLSRNSRARVVFFLFPLTESAHCGGSSSGSGGKDIQEGLW